ncbi:hypothetical protein SAMN05216371_8216 [Streptomyces sp. TLI_053]|nr:hypothetical protein SAMN05216371_8216 [Streptomyces sp. TLI_053]
MAGRGQERPGQGAGDRCPSSTATTTLGAGEPGNKKPCASTHATCETCTACAKALLTVQYDGADEWHTVEGSPVLAPTAAEAEAAHRAMTVAVRCGAAATAADAGC